MGRQVWRCVMRHCPAPAGPSVWLLVLLVEVTGVSVMHGLTVVQDATADQGRPCGQAGILLTS